MFHCETKGLLNYHCCPMLSRALAFWLKCLQINPTCTKTSKIIIIIIIIIIIALVPRVATVREKYLENEIFSRSGKSQGILWMVREI